MLKEIKELQQKINNNLLEIDDLKSESDSYINQLYNLYEKVLIDKDLSPLKKVKWDLKQMYYIGNRIFVLETNDENNYLKHFFNFNTKIHKERVIDDFTFIINEDKLQLLNTTNNYKLIKLIKDLNLNCKFNIENELNQLNNDIKNIKFIIDELIEYKMQIEKDYVLLQSFEQLKLNTLLYHNKYDTYIVTELNDKNKTFKLKQINVNQDVKEIFNSLTIEIDLHEYITEKNNINIFNNEWYMIKDKFNILTNINEIEKGTIISNTELGNYICTEINKENNTFTFVIDDFLPNNFLDIIDEKNIDDLNVFNGKWFINN